MKKIITNRPVFLCALLFIFIVLFFAGCAGRNQQIKDEKDLIETGKKIKFAAKEQIGQKQDRVPGTRREKIVTDDSGEYRLVSTPFGYVKHRIHPIEKEPGEKEQVGKKPGPKEISSATDEKRSKKVQKAVSALPAVGKPEKAEEDSKEDSRAGQIILNFDNADLYEVIRTMAELLNINYLVDPNVRGKVTIHTAGRLKKEDLFPVFYQILEVNGLTAVKEGSLYRIIRLADAQRMPILSRFAPDDETVVPAERIIMQIIPLKHIAATEMTSLLKPFISTGGAIISHGDSNTLLVVDKGINILKALKMAEVFDVDLFEKIDHRFYFLENIEAKETADILKGIISSYDKTGKSDLDLIPIERLNALLAVGSQPRIFEKIEEFIRRLDVQKDETESKIYVYSVKNGEAADLGSLLDQIFGRDSGSDEKIDGVRIKKGEEAKPAPSRNPFAMGKKVKKEAGEAVSGRKGEAFSSGTLKDEINITADEIRNVLIIEAIASDYRIIENILKRIDVLPRQVLIEVTIAEISLDKKTELGIEWTYLKGEGSSLSTTLFSADLGSSGFSYAIGMADRWSSALAALAQDNKVNILSSPSVLASDNKEARIDISTEVPVSSAEYQYTSGTEPVLETNIEYRNTGIILSVTPHINEHGLVTMEISQEVSEQSENVQVGDKNYPSFYNRSVNTTLTVKHSQTIVIGGLIKETRSDGASGAPWLVDIPVIRFLFGKETKSISKTELIIMITPRVITSLEDVDAVTEEFKAKVGNVVKRLR